jgi:hypothetical protein
MEYPAYYDLSTKPVRQHPIPTYFGDPEEATDYHFSVAFWEVEQEQREARRRIVSAIASRSKAEASLRASGQWSKAAVKLGVAMAESEARRMLAMKRAQAMSRIDSPPIAPTI